MPTIPDLQALSNITGRELVYPNPNTSLSTLACCVLIRSSVSVTAVVIRKLTVLRVLQLQMVRRGAADPATLHGLLTNVNGQGQPFDMEITRELEENKQLRDR